MSKMSAFKMSFLSVVRIQVMDINVLVHRRHETKIKEQGGNEE
jgi:hypothetical protein